MSKLWDRILLVPTVVRLASRAPRNPVVAWEGYWRGIRTTGPCGDVLWDSDSLAERAQYADQISAHFDPALPVVDIGCGNGTYTRWLAELFPRVLGIDVSTGAIELASREAEGIPNAEFMVLDATAAPSGELLRERLGPANVFVRGVFHVLKPGKQVALAANLRTVVGDSGRVLLAETNFRGNSLGYLTELGATRQRIPLQLQRALENLPRPGHFGASERHGVFPDSDWRMIADGPVNIEVVPMNAGGLSQWVPGYYALLSGAENSGTEH
ncbi:class I SAM-dependent methyltransferase [Arthrobacter bambusae]|uniref:class I SAM-dependent methyltransferase n=1 Tax=Arthrobacter bambusae TaxID=1338426 RepID=UPI0027807AEF|nr:class I SAM-dependent methyltransferase [Arthrobacter bambusae]MDQ0029356.1 SAM-dependent methyltransferase [Arthrobacter bambusae]MDQ0097016.1 SAM-dependent methyltransferase [Arthrobacter bambusae]